MNTQINKICKLQLRYKKGDDIMSITKVLLNYIIYTLIL